ncbi:MAG: sensor domain-containing diguanylate cyclase [Gallionellaceae bacterium]
MQAHIPTIFIIIIALSFSLAIAIAAVSYRRKQGLMPWALGIALHGFAYFLFSLRGEISDFVSIVIANTAIAFMFSLFTEGLQNFNARQPRKWFVWAPVGVVIIGFSLLLDDLQARTVLSACLWLFQGVLLTYFAYRCRGHFEGRGQYVIMTGSMLLSLVMLLRLIGALNGQFTLTSITTSNPIQTLTFLISIISTLLVVIGVLLMTWERDEQLIKDSEIRLRTLFESTSDAVMLVDERGFFDCNSATLKIFGCPSKTIFFTKSPAELSPPLQPCGENSESLAQKQIAKAKRESTNSFEWMHIRLDSGQSFPAEVLLNSLNISGKHVLQAVVRDITERKQYELELERQAHLDYLTSLNNRRHFMHLAEVELSRSVRYKNSLSLFMMDIDFFKKVNDTYGHKAGDTVLIKLAEICRKTLREVDIVGRIGGEEFAVLLPETDKVMAVEVGERLRANIESTEVTIESGLPINFTVSIGVTSLKAKDPHLDMLLSLADKALYEAKESGRNKVVYTD